MRKLVVSEFITLDGIMEMTAKWSFLFQNEETATFKLDEPLNTDSPLLGKATYQIFAKSWTSRTGDFADRMNKIPKYVVSTTLKQLPWNNSKQIKENIVEEISK